MKVLLISNMYPSEVKPYAGVFVKNQFECLNQMCAESNLANETLDNVEIYYMKRSFTGPVGSLWKYFMFLIKFTPYYFKKYDVIHLHYFYPLIILCWIYKLFHLKVKVIVTFHGGDINTQINGGINQKIFTYLAKCINLAIPVGKALEKAVHQKLSLTRTSVLCAGVDHRIFYPHPSQRLNQKPSPRSSRELDSDSKPLPYKKYDFVFVGTFEAHKGIDLILGPLKELSAEGRLNFCFIGSGSLQAQIESLKEFHHIEIFNNLPQAEIRELFFQSRFHFLPSHMEAFGLVVSEAMFCGVPSIVTPVGGLPEQINDGVNGYVCTETSGPALLEAFKRAISLSKEDYLKMSLEATKNKDKFSLESVCRTQLKLYRELSQGI